MWDIARCLLFVTFAIPTILLPDYRINNVKLEDQGTYICQASNQYGTSAQLVHTLIVGTQQPLTPPVITGTRTAELGKNVSIDGVHGNSSSSYSSNKHSSTPSSSR